MEFGSMNIVDVVIITVYFTLIIVVGLSVGHVLSMTSALRNVSSAFLNPLKSVLKVIIADYDDVRSLQRDTTPQSLNNGNCSQPLEYFENKMCPSLLDKVQTATVTSDYYVCEQKSEDSKENLDTHSSITDFVKALIAKRIEDTHTNFQQDLQTIWSNKESQKYNFNIQFFNFKPGN